MNLEDHWQSALNQVTDAIRMAVSLQTEEALLGERQVVAALYSYFFEQGKAELVKGDNFALHTEAGFAPECRKKCDLRMRYKESDYWMEIKLIYPVRILNGRLIKTPRNKQLEAWKKDYHKLNSIINGRKYFIVINLIPKNMENYYAFQFQGMDNEFGESLRYRMDIDIEWRKVLFQYGEMLIWNCSRVLNEA